MKLKWVGLGVLCASMLGSCSQGADLQDQVTALTRENTALKAEVSALRAQVAAGQATTAAMQANAQAGAERAAVQAYARSCVTAVVTYELDQPVGGIDALKPLDGGPCSAAALSSMMGSGSPLVASSRITVTPGGPPDFTVEVTGVTGQTATLSN
ncbi:hypothetical protein [Deinococcus sp. 6GRE01]|uniref:hypothetical protein n=1 Tax=Deinococcus sp. 6GRE01 TaxID=2745873 RepID=UPI001E307D0A|nr:hypothetical protein [Deinococcus sp. 6GRE01]MCD0156289.1 hypothetical protein [Deinococcus sp. 6GRE01]